MCLPHFHRASVRHAPRSTCDGGAPFFKHTLFSSSGGIAKVAPTVLDLSTPQAPSSHRVYKGFNKKPWAPLVSRLS